MTAKQAKLVPDNRLHELSVVLEDDSYVPGPLDREDLQALLEELLEWREGDRVRDPVMSQSVLIDHTEAA